MNAACGPSYQLAAVTLSSQGTIGNPRNSSPPETENALWKIVAFGWHCLLKSAGYFCLEDGLRRSYFRIFAWSGPENTRAEFARTDVDLLE